MRAWVAGVFCVLGGGVSGAAGGEIDFNRDIRPILSAKCVMCHGPDEAERKGGGDGGLRLDTEAGSRADLGGGTRAVVPGDAEKSELIYRVSTDEDDDVMPPAKSGERLSEAEVALLRQWIEVGGEYAAHWSYVKPERPAVPAVKPGWEKHIGNAVDRFVLARLADEGVEPAAEANRTTLARRVALDLTGLPPTVEEVEAFVNDTKPGAYQRYVEGLLAKPAFGEHWARMWLDLARYADSAGYADDPARTIWAYRDYVIRSLNANKPFDAFTIEQIAGDLIEDPSDEQLVATAFHRNTQTNNEGGTNDEEFRNVAIVDRVNTTMAVWMGTTMACAQCHTHKYDPITHEEYFQMFAILNNTADADRRNEAPTIGVFTDAQKREMEGLRERLATVEAALEKPADGAMRERQRAWEARLAGGQDGWSVAVPRSAGAQSGATMDVGSDGAVLVSGKEAKTDVYEVVLDVPPGRYTGLRLEALPHESLSHWKGPGRKGNFVLNELGVSVERDGGVGLDGRFVRIELPGKGKSLHLAEVEVMSGGVNVARQGRARQSSTGFGGVPERAIDGNTSGIYTENSVSHTADGDLKTWWEVDLGAVKRIDEVVVWNRTDNGLQSRLAGFKVSLLDADRRVVWEQSPAKPPEREVALALDGVRRVGLANASASFEQKDFGVAKVIDGNADGHSGWAVADRLGRRHEAVFELKGGLEIGEGERLKVVMTQSYGDHALGRFRFALSQAKEVPPALPLEVGAALAKGAAQRSAAERQAVEGYYAGIDPATRALVVERDGIAAKLDGMKPATTVPVMQELAGNSRRKTNVQLRGNFLDKGAEVEAGLPAVFHGLPAGEGMDRMGLAKWLVDRNNPLTARVVANRYWEALFGVGIVRTSEEFGAQGELPSHPELLDWLAVELMDSGWDLKHLLKTIVGSATYRQDSRVHAGAFERDPENRLLARGPRFRLSAEMIRDQALSVAGLLSPKMYGAPVKPYQPSLGLKAAFGSGVDWKTSAGEDRYRRGLYTTWRRSSPYPSMAAFDAPNREVCTVRRDRTNTPLQALVTLNDPVYVEAAQGLARRVMGSAEGVPERAKRALELCVTRPPADEEVATVVRLYEAALEQYREDADAARLMATEPIGAVPEGMDVFELAAWTVVGNALLNLDELLMKR